MTLEQLKELAAKATPGPWTWDRDKPRPGGGWVYPTVLYGEDMQKDVLAAEDYSISVKVPDHAFIAAFNPQVVLSLLDCVAALNDGLDPHPCATDHNLFCQEHGCSHPCLVRVAREALAKLKEAGVTI